MFWWTCMWIRPRTICTAFQWRYKGLVSCNKYPNFVYWLRCFLAVYIPIFQPVWLHLSRCMRFLTMWYVRPAKPPISLSIGAVWSEPLLAAWVFYDCLATDWTSFGVSKLKRRLQRLVRVYTCQNVKFNPGRQEIVPIWLKTCWLGYKASKLKLCWTFEIPDHWKCMSLWVWP